MGIILALAMIVSGPLIFDYWWTKRWFRVCWWTAIIIATATAFRR